MAAWGRRGALGALLLGASGAVAAACILHTDSINSPPEVVEISALTTPPVQGPNEFEVVVRDPDQPPETLTVHWRRGAQCPATLTDSMSPAASALPSAPVRTRTTVDIENTRPFCLWVVVTDNQGASAFRALLVEPMVLRPSARITVVRSKPSRWDPRQYELYSTFQLAPPRLDVDADPVTLEWTVAGPDGKTGAGTACPVPDERDICFAAELPGQYLVTLTARNQGGTDTDMKALIVAQDGPPCIRVESATPRLGLPTVSRPLDEPVLFEITVEDDGDPYPETEGRISDHEFVWFVKGPGDTQFVRQSSGSSPQLNTFRLQPRFTFGDEVMVRVLYKDRIRDRDFGSCWDANPDRCALRPGEPACFQWVTWKIQYRE